MSFDSPAFRQALGTFATGVVILTTTDARGGPVGVTINSFASVSLDPPLVLFCLGTGAQVFEAFQSSRTFAVNVLAEHQRSLSDRFAFSDATLRWQGVEYQRSPEQCPLLPGCLAHLQCGLEAIHPAGDHVIILGRVRRLDCRTDGRPLLYFRGQYGQLAPTVVPPAG